ncbi:MipA/OmpV family protein [Paraherbaspirillum soli]|uniref:MipA/OmpV family protein n=1 Tax=Paraherbaspirillum soli TaxID=631222 RepID=A0ABW0MDZ5_9BURK
MKHQIKSIIVVTLYCTLASRMASAEQLAQAQPKAPLQASQITLGLGAGAMPRYAGSDEYRAVPVPVLNIVTPSGFFFDSSQGAGYRFDLSDMLFATTAISYDPGRKDSNDGLEPGSAKLKGMGEIKGSVLAKVGAGIKLGRIGTFTIDVSQPVSNRERGLSAVAQLNSTVLSLTKDRVEISGGVSFGSAKYNQTYFGVSAIQSRNSGYAKYKADSGLNALNSSVTWTHNLSKTWSVSTMLGVTHYVQKAASSPIVLAKTNYSGFTTINYSF